MAKHRHHANQFTFNFDGASTPAKPMSAEHAAIVHAHLPPPVLPPIISRHSTFDFKTQFPPPRQDAIDAGVFGTDVPNDPAIRSIHVEHGKELLRILAEIDAIAEARIDGVDPRTGRTPRGVAAREKLDEFFRTEPGRLAGRFDSLMAVYENAFGEDARLQFERFLSTQHHAHDIEAEFVERYPMPVPEPLPEAVGRGSFGMEDEHTPVNPSREEVFALTENHGKRIVELLERLETIEDQLAEASGEQRTRVVGDNDRTRSALQGLVALYAEDFGEPAARLLEAWARACVGVPTLTRSVPQPDNKADAATPQSSAQYDPGHPWHYLARGDREKPLRVEDIPHAECDGGFVGKLPKDSRKRQAKLSQMLADQTRQLEDDKVRYRDIRNQGVRAISEYDRKIAYCGDEELAVASSLALKFNHISNGLGRVRWLRQQLGMSVESNQIESVHPDASSTPSIPPSLPAARVTSPEVVCPQLTKPEPSGHHTAVSQAATLAAESSASSTPSPVVGSGPLRGTNNGERMQTETQTPASQPSTRVEKLEKLHETVEQALDQLAESLEAGRSETLKAWLTTMSRFHNYSLGNQMLIAWQKPNATHVAGFHAWKKFDRLVSKGEKGIMILAPVTRVVATVKEEDAAGKLAEKPIRQLVNTKVVYVFDVSQTHGEPLPELPGMRGNPAIHLSKIKDLIQARGIELYFAERLSMGAQGLSEGGRIGIVQGLSPAEEFRTLAHELAHELLHRGERRKETTKRSRELEAESVAFVVSTAIGLDARETSTDYIHLFRGDKAALLESLQFIRAVAKDILSALLPSEEMH